MTSNPGNDTVVDCIRHFWIHPSRSPHWLKKEVWDFQTLLENVSPFLLKNQHLNGFKSSCSLMYREKSDYPQFYGPLWPMGMPGSKPSANFPVPEGPEWCWTGCSCTIITERSPSFQQTWQTCYFGFLVLWGCSDDVLTASYHATIHLAVCRIPVRSQKEQTWRPSDWWRKAQKCFPTFQASCTSQTQWTKFLPFPISLQSHLKSLVRAGSPAENQDSLGP